MNPNSNEQRPTTTTRKKEKRRRKQIPVLLKKLVVVFVIGCCIIIQLNWLLNLQNTNDEGSLISVRQQQSIANSDRSTTTNPFENNKRKRKLLEWKDGCLSSSSSSSVDSSTAATTTNSKSALTSQNDNASYYYFPKGIIVTMALAPKGNRQFINDGRIQICTNLKNQWELFALQQSNVDFLLIVQDENIRWNLKRFSKCLGLFGLPNNTQSWIFEHNNSTLTTTSYQYTSSTASSFLNDNNNNDTSNTTNKTSNMTIYLASTVVDYPLFIQRNMSKLEERKLGYSPGCSARLRYLQGNRWYTYEMLYLSLLKEYDYFIKMDYDIVFTRPLKEFNLLFDMYRKGKVFGHTAQYHPKGDGSCSAGILNAITDFMDFANKDSNHNNNSTKSSLLLSKQQQEQQQDDDDAQWKKSICSLKSKEMNRDADQYYCNFIIGSIEYFTSPIIRKFGQYLSEWPTNGFFKYKWGDQVFWHYALGLLLEEDYKAYVEDYTDLRCKPDPNCWYSVFDTTKYGRNASAICSGSKNIFAHTKNLDLSKQVLQDYHLEFKWQRQQQPPRQDKPPRQDNYPLFQSTYKHCQP